MQSDSTNGACLSCMALARTVRAVPHQPSNAMIKTMLRMPDPANDATTMAIGSIGIIRNTWISPPNSAPPQPGSQPAARPAAVPTTSEISAAATPASSVVPVA